MNPASRGDLVVRCTDSLGVGHNVNFRALFTDEIKVTDESFTITLSGGSYPFCDAIVIDYVTKPPPSGIVILVR